MVTNKGVEISLCIIPLAPSYNMSLAVLDCTEHGEVTESLLGIVVQASPLLPTRLYRRKDYGLVRV
jgi:hypothetical protein